MHYKKYKNFLKVIIIIAQMLNLFLLTSCTLKNLKNNNDFVFHETNSQLRKLIIPRGITIPSNKQAYNTPYTQKDLEKEDYDIFPPA